MPVAPATIVRTNRSWPGTSTTDSRRPDGQLERRVAELDRDPARALLGQAVGVDAGQRARPARSCRGRCGRRSRASAAALIARGAASAAPDRRRRPRRRSSVRGSSSSAPSRIRADHRRVAVAQPPRQRVGAGAPGRRAHDRALELEQRQRAAADLRAASITPRRRRPPARAARPAPQLRLGRRRASRSTGISRRARSGSRYRRSVASSAASDSLSIRTARASGWARQPLDRLAPRPTISPACGPPSSLSPEKQTSARAGRDRAAHRRLVGQLRHAARRARPSRRRRSPARPSRAQRLDLAPPPRTRRCGSSTGARA